MSIFSFPQQVNERAARIVAGVVSSAIVLAFLSDTPAIVAALALGFWLRVGWGPKVSPLARVAVFLARKRQVPVPGAPKRFAQLLGALFTTASSALLFGGYTSVGWALALTVAALASLESALAACLGCWIYGVCAPRARALVGDAPSP